VSPATLERERLFRPSLLDPVEHEHDHEPHASTTGGGPTLDELLVGVWEGLSAHRTVPCPACGGALTPRYGAGPGPVGGRCRDCGTTIE
jgi:hypothetical protein